MIRRGMAEERQEDLHQAVLDAQKAVGEAQVAGASDRDIAHLRVDAITAKRAWHAASHAQSAAMRGRRGNR